MTAGMTAARTPLLQIRGLTVRFGGLVAINALDLDVTPGQIFALIGPNGAGKTTVLNCISGFVRPAAGSIHLDGAELLRLRRSRRADLGIGRTFQNIQLFGTQTVLENVLTAQHAHLRAGVLRGMLALGGREDAAARSRAVETLSLLGLSPYVDAPAGALPFGVQQLVGIARALVLRPRLLLLDEPAAGMPHADVDKLATELRRWRDELGTTLVLIEHNMRLVQAAADHVCVLDYGSKLAEGEPGAVLRDAAVLEAYLGRGSSNTGSLVAEDAGGAPC
jgi:branched-chain amino acid transport system ATP-binding protein